MLEFRILGPLEVADGSDVLQLHGPRERALLAYLLLKANRVVPGDRIINDIWGDEPPRTVTSMLHVYVSRLRKVLNNGEACTGLFKEPGGYVLRIDDTQLDLHRFESLAQTGQEMLAGGDAQGAGQELRRALALWRGAPLADLANEPWAEIEISRLEESHLAALEARIDADLELGRHTDVAPELEKLVAEHPLRERPRAQLMLALYRSGRQAEALRYYDDARRVLADQLGLEPGPTLKRLQKGILAQEPALDLAGPESRKAPRRRRSALLLIAFAAALLVTGTIVAATFVGSSHPAPRTLRGVPPDSVGVIDTATNRLVDAVSIGGRVSGLAYGADSIWVGNYDGQTLIRIDPATARVVDTVALPGRPTDIAYAAGRVWVSSASADLLIRIDPRYGTIDRRIHLHQAAYSQGVTPYFAPLAAGHHGLWIGHDVSALSRIDPVRATLVKQLTLDEPVVALAEGPNDVWAVKGGEASLVAVNPISNSIESNTPLPGWGGPVVAGPQVIWVASPDTDEVWRVDPVTRKPTAIVHVDGHPNSIALGAGSVWTANQLGDTVSRIDPSTGRIVSTIHIGNNPLALTVFAKRVWVTTS